MMHAVLLACGLPGPAYHGGAVTCWACVTELLARGHRVTVLTLFDSSPFNPYTDSRDLQTAQLEALGAQVRIIDYDFRELAPARGGARSILRKAAGVLRPRMEQIFPWRRLRGAVEEALADIRPDAIFCYHFDALSAVYDSSAAPVMAGVGDVWHDPPYYRWLASGFTARNLLAQGPKQLAFRHTAIQLMREMLRPVAKRGAFAAHYAEWLDRRGKVGEVLYLRTPAHDPVGAAWRELRDAHRARRAGHPPKILMIGDLTGTAAQWGLRILKEDVLPALESRFGPSGFEIHLVGGGRLEPAFADLADRPSVRVRGRITPPDEEFLDSDVLFVPTPIPLGIRVRIITGFSYGSCLVAHAANAAGIPEIEAGVNALVAKSGKGLAAEMIRALEDPGLRRRLEAGARRTYEECFTEEVAAGRIVRELEELAGNESPSRSAKARGSGRG